ncbi:MAG: SpoIVB peptidase S55 domain-containing protein [Hespellia sp.]|nr:SpoIVB peptidase S55 domain-containing protein [Hespellia sp.]
MTIQRYRKILVSVAVIASLVCGSLFYSSFTQALSPDHTADVSDIQDNMVLLGGMPVGIYLQTDGVMVIGTGTIEAEDGSSCSPAEHKVHAGDYITAVNEASVENKKSLIEQIEASAQKDVILTVRRNKEELQIKTEAVTSRDGKKMLGIWVRDDVQGLGTVTYIKNHTFAALGHGIHDMDTSCLLEISGGLLYRTNIRSISKSTKESPGSMEGIIVYSKLNELGTIQKNRTTGIYGTIEDADAVLDEKIPIQTAPKEEITLGNATVRCKVENEVKEYQIRIDALDFSNHEINKGMTIEITDPELLAITGGIVQGMSGSPIIQNGKLVGAVTHVFIKDSKKGYGIFIENMMKN